jgi:hypothetical protein
MCERAILLFNEYINISKNYGNESTNMVDVQQFIINKTVGPLKIENKVSNDNIIEVTNLSQIFEDFTYKLFAKIVDIDKFYYSYDNFMESIASILSNILYKINHIGESEYIREELYCLLDYDILDIPREVNLLKIKLELFYYSYNHIQDIELSKMLAEKTIEENIDNIDESYDINEFFDWQQNINDKDFFQQLILELKNNFDS